MKKLIFLAFIFITFSAFSQETISVNYKLKPLKEVLTNVEENRLPIFLQRGGCKR